MTGSAHKNTVKREYHRLEQFRAIYLLASILIPLNMALFYILDDGNRSTWGMGFFFTASFFLIYILSNRIAFIKKKISAITFILFFLMIIASTFSILQTKNPQHYLFFLVIAAVLLTPLFQDGLRELILISFVFSILFIILWAIRNLEDSGIILLSIYIIGVSYFFMNVYDRKHIKAELSKSEKHFQLFMENSPVGYFYLDENGTITDMNRAMLDMYDLSNPQQMAGKKCSILNEDCNCIPEKCDMAQKASCLSGKLLRRTLSDGDIRYHIIWVPSQDNEKSNGLEGFALDVSDRIYAEEEKEKQFFKYNQLFNSINQGFVVLEAVKDFQDNPMTFQFVEVNQGYERLTGLKRETLIGKTLQEGIPGYDLSWIEEYKEILSQKESRKLERFSAFFGKFFDIHVYPFDEDKLGLLISDVTQKIEIEQQLKRAKETAEDANQLKSKFLHNITHELRTPMNGIVGMLQLLQMTDLDEEQKEEVLFIREASYRMLNLIKNIMDLVEAESSTDIEKTVFKLRALVEEVVFNARGTMPENKPVEIISEVDAALPDLLYGDEIGLRKIFEEFVSNALKFTESGMVKLTAKKVRTYCGERGTSMVEFCVEDTGIGIGQDMLPLLFHMFSQADESFTKKYQGAGIGLALCQKLSERMDAKISVQSELGKGTCFTLYVVLERVEEECG